MHTNEAYFQAAFQPRKGDERLYVEFKNHPLHDPVASEQAGRPIYVDTEYVRIVSPGSRDVYFQPATPADKARFKVQYEQFKAGQDATQAGTPLALLPGVTQAQIEEFAHFNIRTIEGLVSISEAVGMKFPGIQALKQKARAFLEAAEQNAPLTRMQAALDARDSKIASLEAQLKELAEAVATQGKGKR